jgi:hypothetical protein
VSKEGLKAISHRDDSLSFTALTVRLASGENSSPISVTTYLTDGPIRSYHADGSFAQLPSVRVVGSDIEIYVDPMHPLFQQAGVAIDQQVAAETSAYLFSLYQSQASKFPAEHSLTKLIHEFLYRYRPEKYTTSEVDAELESLFSSLKSRLADALGAESADVYANVPQEEKTALASELVRQGRDVAELSLLKDNGQFVHFLRPQGIVAVFRYNPKLFFDGKVWTITYADIAKIDAAGAERIQAQIRNEYGSLLEIAAVYATKGAGNSKEAELARAACRLLFAKLGVE